MHSQFPHELRPDKQKIQRQDTMQHGAQYRMHSMSSSINTCFNIARNIRPSLCATRGENGDKLLRFTIFTFMSRYWTRCCRNRLWRRTTGCKMFQSWSLCYCARILEEDILTDKLVQCICRNIDCAWRKESLYSRWKIISRFAEFTWPCCWTLTNWSDVKYSFPRRRANHRLKVMLH